MKDHETTKRIKITDEEDIVEILLSIFSNNSKINIDFIKEKVLKDD